MNYERIYRQLISRSRENNRNKDEGVYYESHHIIPKCIGGLNESDNLVLFTAREHFIAHWLLTKIYPDNPKIIFAFNCFSLKKYGSYSSCGQLDHYCARNYEYARKKVSQMLKNKPISKERMEALINITYVNNGKVSKRIKKYNLNHYLQNGWSRGRIKYTRVATSQETKMKISKANKGRKLPPDKIIKLKKFCENNPHCWVSKDGISKQIWLKDLKTYLDSGWVRGRHALKGEKLLNTVWVCYNNTYKAIPLCNLSLYENFGWAITTEPKSPGKHHLSRTWVHKEEYVTRIFKEEIPIYLYLGYSLGRKII